MSFDVAASPRWRGQDDRVEVWYSTITDPTTGTGVWIHYEVVSPVATRGVPHGHGWIACFPPDAPPACERFGPSPVDPDRGAAWFEVPEGRIDATGMTGRTATMAWDLAWERADDPLWTFPAAAWTREVLPGAQVVPIPSTQIRGTITGRAGTLSLDGAQGNVAHIYGHGNAKRWAWLHADLGGGDLLEIVTAVSRIARARPAATNGVRPLPDRRPGLAPRRDPGGSHANRSGSSDMDRARSNRRSSGGGRGDGSGRPLGGVDLHRPRWRNGDVHQQLRGRRRHHHRTPPGRTLGGRTAVAPRGHRARRGRVATLKLLRR